MDLSKWKTLACTSGSLFLGGVAFKLLSGGKLKSKNNDDVPVNEVLLYGANDATQRKKIGLNNLFCIYYIIVHANSSIDVCVPNLKSDTITKCLIGAQQKNKVKVRLVVHSNCDFDLEKLTKHGIEVKVVRSQQPLEHEFILVDASEHEAVAVLGSLDYETSRVNCNRDATLLTSEPSVVKTLKKEFDRVWNSIDDNGNDEN